MRERTRIDYERRIERVLLHVVEHLDEAPSLDALADLAAFSRFHFQRVFRSVTGESVAELMRRLRLERAGARLRAGAGSITDLALEAGYESTEAFSRAFRRACGVSPSEYRDAWPPPALGPRATRVRYRPGDGSIVLEPVNGGLPMNVEIVSRPATRYASIHHIGPYNEVGPCFERLWGWVSSGGVRGAPGASFTLSWDDPDSVDAAELRSAACLEIGEHTAEAQDEIEIATMPARRWATYVHVGPYDGIVDAYRRMFGEWLPRSGETLAEHPCMEVYLDDPARVAPQELRTRLCMPLEA